MRPSVMNRTRSLRTAPALLLGLLIAAGAVLAVPGTAYACSCVAAGPRQYLEWADAVVWADVVEVSKSTPIGEAHYLLEVDRVYKGEVTRSVQVDSNASGAACGLEGIESDRSYAFFLDGDGSPYSATLCGGTGAVARDRLERVVGAGAPGAADPSETSDPDEEAVQGQQVVGSAPAPGGPERLPVSAWSWAGIATGALGTVAGSIVWLLRRRSTPAPQ